MSPKINPEEYEDDLGGQKVEKIKSKKSKNKQDFIDDTGPTKSIRDYRRSGGNVPSVNIQPIRRSSRSF